MSVMVPVPLVEDCVVNVQGVDGMPHFSVVDRGDEQSDRQPPLTGTHVRDGCIIPLCRNLWSMLNGVRSF